MYSDNGKYRSDCFTPRELQLSNSLRKLWVEHVMWTRSFIISAASNSKDLGPVTQRLLRNPADFAALLTPYYGSKVAKRFEELLTAHLLIAAQLVNAAKEGDAASVAELRKKWYANADDIAVFLSEINPYWTKKEWQSLLYDHLRMTENEAVQILTKQYEASISEYDAIEAEALKMADVMSSGIIKQFKI